MRINKINRKFALQFIRKHCNQIIHYTIRL